MDEESIKALENLSLYCYYCGIIPIFLGILIIFVDVMNNNIPHILVGLFIFISGYAFVKISAVLTKILIIERDL